MQRRTLWRLSTAILLVLLGASLATVAAAGWSYWQIETTSPPAAGFTPELVSEKLDAYDKRADQLEKMLTLLLGLSTVYAFALALGAYQQLKDSAGEIEKLTRAAEEKIEQLPSEIASVRKEAREDIESFVLKIQEKFPLLADMDMAIREIMDRLMQLLPVIDWSDEDEYYTDLTPQLKQEILFYEKTVAAFEYFDLKRLPRVGRTASEIYHGLGNFYGQKYVAEGKTDDETKERSRFYLDRALYYNGKNTGALNDRVFYALRIDDPPDLELARKLLTSSLAADPDQQRAAYNLAWIEQSEKNYSRSEELLGKALGMTKWQKSPARDIHIQNMHYNRACARARLAEGEALAAKRNTWAEEALQDLEEIFRPGNAPYKPELVRAFDEDVKPHGDLGFLASNEPWKTEIGNITRRLHGP